jgi:hypothetical protein
MNPKSNTMSNARTHPMSNPTMKSATAEPAVIPMRGVQPATADHRASTKPQPLSWWRWGRWRAFSGVLLGVALSACAAPAPTEVDGSPRPENMNRGELTEYVAKARALFAERCQKAGVRITRTVSGERGVFVMKLRPSSDYDNEYALVDQYGDDFTGDGYLRSFLKGFNDETLKIQPELKFPTGFDFVDAINPKDGLRYRYTAKTEVIRQRDRTAPGVIAALKEDPNFDMNVYGFLLRGTPTQEPAPRYGVTFDDISTKEDRDYWIAGSSLRVVDLQTNEVIAERIGYMQDPRLGAKGRGRAPWIFAASNACPELINSRLQARQTMRFVRQVLISN